jgi:tetratricopeptide (TPR) repeat protein
LTDATVLRIGQLVGADSVVLGSLQLEGDVLIVRARSIALDAGRIQVDVSERGPLADLYAIFERIARRIAPPSNRTSAEVEGQHPPVAAFENFIKGLLAETPATAVGYLQAALKQAPSFDRARFGLWDVYTEQDDHAAALGAVTPVDAASPFAARALFLAGLSQLELRKYDDAFATFKALADAGGEATALNNLGVVQLRRGATAETGRATYYFNQAVEADRENADYAFNIGSAYWLDHDPQAAVYWLREAVRRQPADGVAHYVLAAALQAGGSAAEAGREKELARRLSSTFDEWDRRPAADPVPHDLERIKPYVELPHGSGIAATINSNEQRDQQELAHFYLESGRRLYERDLNREAAAELNRALYLAPYLAEAHLLLGRIHLRNGRIRDAIDAFKISLWSAETAAAHAALGEAYRQNDEAAAAKAEAERALALDPELAEAKALAARLEGR